MDVPDNWFETWFNTSYYDLLYRSRNAQEAAEFLDHLLAYLHPAPGATMLDAACGKGRHAVYLASKGYDVTGIDLSFRNIREAAKMENAHLSFLQHDIRRLFRVNYFDYIFNFFTSFGYFSTNREQAQTLHNFALGLKRGGTLVIDFLNAGKLQAPHEGEETRDIDAIHFHIRKLFDGTFTIKEIAVDDHGTRHTYYEKVMAMRCADFVRFLSAAGLEIRDKFGNYALEPFDEAHSERLIIVARK